MEILGKIAQQISGALASKNLMVDPSHLVLTPTRKEFRGSHTFTCFQYAKELQVSPEELGNFIGQYLAKHLPEISHYNVVKGFLNLELSDAFWMKTIESMYDQGQPVWFSPKTEKVLIEYASPNTNKPLHLGHLRNVFLGDALSRILTCYGYEVVRANLINDRGIHICKSMMAYLHHGDGRTPENTGIKGDHFVGEYYVLFDKLYREESGKLRASGISEEKIDQNNWLMCGAQELLRKWEEKDPDTLSLWRIMNGWVYAGFDQTFKNFGIDFDSTYYESDTYLLGKKIVEEGIEKGIFYKKNDGSVWIDLTADGLDEKLVQRADGTSVYITQDLGTADLKYADHLCNKSIYVVGNEQDYHFKVLFLILQKLQRPYAQGLYHLSYGMVDLPTGKMKSREGTVVDADDLYNEMLQEAENQTILLGKTEGFTEDQRTELYRTIGLGALKYFLLKVDPKKRMLFNPAESIDFQGNTGPFIQYTYARIRSLLRKANHDAVEASRSIDGTLLTLHVWERHVLYQLSAYEKTVEEAAQQYTPALIANYVYELSKLFNTFYAELNVLQEPHLETRRFRIMLSDVVSKTIKHGMQLLGIEVPEKM